MILREIKGQNARSLPAAEPTGILWNGQDNAKPVTATRIIGLWEGKRNISANSRNLTGPPQMYLLPGRFAALECYDGI